MKTFKKNDLERWKKIWGRRNELQDELFNNLQDNLKELGNLLKEASSHWTYEDPIYRFYHHSFKVYALQDQTLKFFKALKKLTPKDCWINSQFQEIIDNGTGKEFNSDHNGEWFKHTGPILEAFFHAKFFLEMAVKYGSELKEPPTILPSGWAAFLYLYNLR